MKNKLLLGIFLTGVLLFGIGTGIAFAEYSAFSYEGEVALGTEKNEVDTKEYIVPLSDKKTRINNYTMKEMDVVEDKKLKDGQVRIEVISNPDYVQNYWNYEPYDDSFLEEGYDPEYINGYEGEIQIHLGRKMGEFELFMEYKDDILKDLKDKVVKSYYLDAVKSVTVKANAKTLKYLDY